MVEKNKSDLIANEQLLRQLLEEEKIELFREHFLEIHPYDRAQFYELIGAKQRQILYRFLSPGEMADVFEALELEDDEYEGFLSEMDTSYGAAMLSFMYTDDAVDVLNELDEDQRESYLEMMDTETVQEINELLSYPEYTAGAIMTTEYVSIIESSTVRSAMAVLRKKAPEAETI